MEENIIRSNRCSINFKTCWEVC